MQTINPGVLTLAMWIGLGGVVGCTRSPQQGGSSARSALIQTDRPVYTARVDRQTVGLTIGLLFTNRTNRTAYLAGCGGVDPPALEKQLEEGWTLAYAPLVDLCEATPHPVNPGEVYRYTYRVAGGQPEANFFPKFQVREIEGTYRVVWEIYGDWKGRDARAREDLLPLEQRTSNPFQVVR